MFLRISLLFHRDALEHLPSTSTLKWPALDSSAPSFITAKSRSVMTSEQPVTVTKIASREASFIFITSKPSITASMALTGSTSVTMTFAPSPLRAPRPLPHQP